MTMQGMSIMERREYQVRWNCWRKHVIDMSWLATRSGEITTGQGLLTSKTIWG